MRTDVLHAQVLHERPGVRALVATERVRMDRFAGLAGEQCLGRRGRQRGVHLQQPVAIFHQGMCASKHSFAALRSSLASGSVVLARVSLRQVRGVGPRRAGATSTARRFFPPGSPA